MKSGRNPEGSKEHKAESHEPLPRDYFLNPDWLPSLDTSESLALERQIYDDTRAQIAAKLEPSLQIADLERGNGCVVIDSDGHQIKRLEYRERYYFRPVDSDPLLDEPAVGTKSWFVLYPTGEVIERVFESSDEAVDYIYQDKIQRDGDNSRREEEYQIHLNHQEELEKQRKTLQDARRIASEAYFLETQENRDPRLWDKNYLPSIDEIRKNYPIIDPESKINSYEERERETRAWFGFVELLPQRDILTREYVERFANYLTRRIAEIRNQHQLEKVAILEVGAGDGRLAHFLKAALREKAGDTFKLVAVDDKSWPEKEMFPVVQVDFRQALDEYHPQIVISSWMPNRVDWTEQIRKRKSVEEYLLIGRADEDVVGKGWETWGNDWTAEHEGQTPPFVKDGFTKEILEEISEVQIHHMAYDADTRSRYPSITASFRRHTSTS